MSRILVAAPLSPGLDAANGGARVLANLMTRLAASHELSLVHLRADDEPPADASVRAACADVVEVPRRPVGRSPVRAWRERRRIWLRLRGADPWEVGCSVAAFAPALRRAAEAWKPHVIQFEFGVTARYAAAVDGLAARRVLVEHDPGRTTTSLRAGFDAVVVFTERDERVVAAAAPARVVRIPIGVDVPERPLDALGSDPPSILFAGSYVHAPNADAAERLATKILPLVLRTRPDASLVLLGHPPLRDLASRSPAVVVTGLVEDVTPYLDRAAVVAAPIRLGGGMRVKVLEALAAGKALVASDVAVAGVGVADGVEYVRAETDEEFASRIGDLLDAPERRRALGAAAYAWARANLGWDAVAARWLDLYAELLA